MGDLPANYEISNVLAKYLVILAVLAIQAVVLETYVITLVLVLSTVLYVVFACPQPTLQWETEYLPMAKSYATQQLGLETMQDMVIAITGSTSGIGMELTRLFAKNGVTVIAIGRSESKLKALQAEYPKSIRMVLCDLTDLESVAKAADEMNAKFDRLDVLVNNAGVQLGMQNLWKGLSSTKQGHDLVFGGMTFSMRWMDRPPLNYCFWTSFRSIYMISLTLPFFSVFLRCSKCATLSQLSVPFSLDRKTHPSSTEISQTENLADLVELSLDRQWRRFATTTRR
jgi:NADPH:quinone reductase-like Zn-dependent oxidoreductase